MKKISKKADLIVQWIPKTNQEFPREILDKDMKEVDLDTKKIQMMRNIRALLTMMNDNKIIDFY